MAPGLTRITALRPINHRLTHVRVTHAAFPHTFVIPLSETMTITQLHVPVDDTHTWMLFYTVHAPEGADSRKELPCLDYEYEWIRDDGTFIVDDAAAAIRDYDPVDCGIGQHLSQQGRQVRGLVEARYDGKDAHRRPAVPSS